MIEALVEQTRFNDQARVVCPFCGPDRRKSNSKDMTLSRKDDGAVVYFCHHCDAQGSVQPKRRIQLAAVPQPKIVSNALSQHHYEWLAKRGISKYTADKAKLFSADKWFARLNKTADCIGFPYYRDGALVAAKYQMP